MSISKRKFAAVVLSSDGRVKKSPGQSQAAAEARRKKKAAMQAKGKFAVGKPVDLDGKHLNLNVRVPQRTVRQIEACLTAIAAKDGEQATIHSISDFLRKAIEGKVKQFNAALPEELRA